MIDNVDDTNLKRLAGRPAVSVAATPRPAQVTEAIIEVSRAEREYDAAHADEQRKRQALADAMSKTAWAAHAVHRARLAYDQALQLERRMRIDPAA